MNVRTLVATLVIGAVGMGTSTTAVVAAQAAKKAAPAKKAAAAARVIELTGDDTMKYNITAVEAKPGETLTVRLKNTGMMPKMASAHNFVLLKKATDIVAFTTAAVMAQATEYIPAKFEAQIVAHTKMAGPGETVEVTFKAPTAPGPYNYICSFPGHFTTMKGVLTVK